MLLLHTVGLIDKPVAASTVELSPTRPNDADDVATPTETATGALAEAEDIDGSESKPVTLKDRKSLVTGRPRLISSTQRSNSMDRYSASFVDKLLSSFDKNARSTERTTQKDNRSGQFNKDSTVFHRRLPNGHKYGEYQVSRPFSCPCRTLILTYLLNLSIDLSAFLRENITYKTVLPRRRKLFPFHSLLSNIRF